MAKNKEYVGVVHVPLVIHAKSLKSAKKLAANISKNLGWCVFTGGESAECGRSKIASVKMNRNGK